MALYNRLKEINSLIQGNLLRSSNLTLVEYYETVVNKNSAAGFFVPFMFDAGVDMGSTVGEVLQRNQYFGILDRFLSEMQKNESFNRLKNTNNKDVLFTDSGNVELLEGDTTAYGYPNSSVLLNMVAVNDTMTDGNSPMDTFYRKYRLVGSIYCGEAAETTYILPIGIISNNDLANPIIVRGGASNSTVSCTDTVFIDVTTPLNNDCYVTDVSTGDYVSATNGWLSFDNTIIGPADYYVFLTLASTVDMIGKVNIDQIIELESPAPNASVSFQTV